MQINKGFPSIDGKVEGIFLFDWSIRVPVCSGDRTRSSDARGGLQP